VSFFKNRTILVPVKDSRRNGWGDFSVPNKTAAAVAIERETSLDEFPSATQHQRSPFAGPIEHTGRISDLELETFQVALVPFPKSDLNAGPNRIASGGSRMVLLPMTWKQLMSRVRKEIVSSPADNKTNLICFGEVRVDVLSMEVRRSGRLVELTAMEFKLLKFFVSNPNRVISRSDLLDEVWGYENYPSTRTVDNHILRLRRKLEPELSNPAHFRTVHGVGYKFTP
jgi:hypothetical protein